MVTRDYNRKERERGNVEKEKVPDWKPRIYRVMFSSGQHASHRNQNVFA